MRIAALAIVGVTLTAHAEPAKDRVDLAAKLFEEGRELAKLARFPEACDRFAKSYELDPASGTAINFADCQEHIGHLSRAWQLFDEVAKSSAGTNTVRAQYARDRADALLPRLGTIVVKLADRRLDRISLSIGGRDVAPAAELHQHVDPGDVEIVAVAPERRFAVTAHATARRTVTVDIPALGRQSGDRESAGRQRRWVIGAVALGGVGIGGVLLAGGLAVAAARQYNDAFSRGECFYTPRGDECTPYGLEIVDNAHARANLATGLFVGGAVLVATGIAVYVWAPRIHGVDVAPSASADSAGISLTGKF